MPQQAYKLRRFDRQRTENRKNRQGLLKRTPSCFYLALLIVMVWLMQSSLATHQNLKQIGATQSKATKRHLPLLSAPPISFDSTARRKLIHVISPFVDVIIPKTRTGVEGRRSAGTVEPAETKSAKETLDEQKMYSPMSMGQMTILSSIQRSRDVFDQHIHKEQTRIRHGMNYPTMASLAFDNIELVCAVLAEDVSQLQHILRTTCDKIEALPRSTKTAYGFNRSLPFLSDILEAPDRARMPNYLTDQHYLTLQQDDNFYLFTNADIGLSRDFYIHLDSEVRERQASALSINRMTLDMDTKGNGIETTMIQSSGSKAPDANTRRFNGTAESASDLAADYLRQADELIGNNEFQHHPGYDCFLFHSSVLKRIHFGDFFVGFPPFGANVHLALRIMAPNYDNLASNPNGTFHLGNDRDWHTANAKIAGVVESNHHPSKQQSVAEPSYEFWTKFQEDLHYLPWCPISNHPPSNEHTMQNSINCGKWFRPNREWSPGNPKSSNVWPWQKSNTFSIPAFVREGFEAIYVQNYAKYLNYTSEGMPLVPGHQTPKIKRRRPKIVKNREKNRLKNKQDDGLVSFLLYQLLQTVKSFSN